MKNRFAFIRANQRHPRFNSQVPGVGIEPTPSWFRARRRYQQQLPRSELVLETCAVPIRFGEQDLNLHARVQSPLACR